MFGHRGQQREAGRLGLPPAVGCALGPGGDELFVIDCKTGECKAGGSGTALPYIPDAQQRVAELKGLLRGRPVSV